MVEYVFGHLAARFQVFGSAIRLYPLKVEQITVSVILQHNYLIDRHDRKFTNKIYNLSIRPIGQLEMPQNIKIKQLIIKECAFCEK